MAYKVGDNKNLGKKRTKWEERKANNRTYTGTLKLGQQPRGNDGGLVFKNARGGWQEKSNIKLPLRKPGSDIKLPLGRTVPLSQSAPKAVKHTNTANTDFDKRFNSIAGNDRLDRKRALMSSKAYKTKYNKSVNHLNNKDYKPPVINKLLPLSNINSNFKLLNKASSAVSDYVVKQAERYVHNVQGNKGNEILGVPLETLITAGKKIATSSKNTIKGGRNLYKAITEASNVKRMKADVNKATTKGVSLLNLIAGKADAVINKPKNRFEERKNRPVLSLAEYQKQYEKGIDPSFVGKMRRRAALRNPSKYKSLFFTD